MRLFENAKYPFMEWRKRAYIITALLLLGTIGAMAANFSRQGSPLNYGVDFTGGTLVQVRFDQPTSVDKIRSAASAAGNADWQIAAFGSDSEYTIRMASFQQGTAADAGTRVDAALTPAFGAGKFDVVRTEAVGPKVGDELQSKALLAILLSMLVTMVYLWFRFEWRFGVAAIVATAHDIVITLGILAMLRSEISLGTVAAFLTIVGYSLNDTIVVFDRIREDLAKPRHGKTYMELLNQAINETLPRTVLTASGTLATLLSLAILGGPVIRDFAVVLILGIFIGTFSSIFVASPVLYFIESKWPHKTPTKQAAPSHSGRPRARTAV